MNEASEIKKGLENVSDINACAYIINKITIKVEKFKSIFNSNFKEIVNLMLKW